MASSDASSNGKIADFQAPYEKHLDPDNRWILLSKRIPWAELIREYSGKISIPQGHPTVPLRRILGTLLVQQLVQKSDEAVIDSIQENVYTQFLVGLPTLQTAPIFDPSLLDEVRRQLGEDGTAQLIQRLLSYTKGFK